jgi:putative photosynthetic complex assembly protein 2
MTHVLAALFVLGVWWLSTGAILWIDGLPRTTFRFSLAAATGLALAGLVGLRATSQVPTAGGAYLAFGCALLVWSWHELSFLLGVLTGPRKEPCPEGARGLRRFVYATAAVLHHEIALALTLVAVALLTWGAPNQVGASTFLVLWVMRLSAKLNLFLGVRNLTTEFIPEHLRYLLSYFRKKRLNPLMPVSLLAGGAAVVRLFSASAALEASAFAAVGGTLVATILALAVVEHLFLLLPLPDVLLWRWALRPAPLPPPGPLGEDGR